MAQYTMIDDLPDVSEIDYRNSNNNNSGLAMVPRDISDKIAGKIRNTSHQFHDSSGMNNMYNQNPNNFNGIIEPSYYHMDQADNGPTHIFNRNSCVDVSEHTVHCTVCSKLYNNNNTVFILVIIFLAIVNLLLLKRILES